MNQAVAPSPDQSSNVIEITQNDLPLSCPTPETALWSAHPRVFIPIEDAKGHHAKCPYCGTEFRLV